MRAFVCVGLAIIGALTIMGIQASYCLTCCNGEPCSPKLRMAHPELLREPTP